MVTVFMCSGQMTEAGTIGMPHFRSAGRIQVIIGVTGARLRPRVFGQDLRDAAPGSRIRETNFVFL
jgi:hypothetical protein